MTLENLAWSNLAPISLGVLLNKIFMLVLVAIISVSESNEKLHSHANEASFSSTSRYIVYTMHFCTHWPSTLALDREQQARSHI